MWILVFFDLPTDTKKERKAAAKFRKDIMGDGFTMFQFSISCFPYWDTQAPLRLPAPAWYDQLA